LDLVRGFLLWFVPLAIGRGWLRSRAGLEPVYSLDQDGTYSAITYLAMRTLPQETRGHTQRGLFRRQLPAFCVAVFIVLSSLPARAKTKTKGVPAVSSNIEVTATLADAMKAVEEVASDPTMYGTYVYERDKTLTGARQVDSSSAFGKDAPEGKTLYKVVDNVLAPRHFRDAEDSGTVTVRYLVRAVNPATVRIRVDAVFIESARRTVHASEGAVESAEFGQVQQHLNRIQAREKEALEAAKEQASETTKPELQEKGKPGAKTLPDVAPGPAELVPAPAAAVAGTAPTNVAAGDVPSAASGSVAELEQRVNRLRHQVEARIKQPGAPLKSAPFHTATTIQTVPGDSEVAVVILTSYWYGVQTTDGHTGWIQRRQLEALP